MPEANLVWMSPKEVEFLSTALATVLRFQPDKKWSAALTSKRNVLFHTELYGIDLRLECRRIDIKESFGEDETQITTLTGYEWTWWLLHGQRKITPELDLSMNSCREAIQSMLGAVVEILRNMSSSLEEQLDAIPEEDEPLKG